MNGHDRGKDNLCTACWQLYPCDYVNLWTALKEDVKKKVAIKHETQVGLRENREIKNATNNK